MIGSKNILVLIGLLLVGGCATNPVTGRSQFIGLPGLQTAYANFEFALGSGRNEAPAPCAGTSGGEAARASGNNQPCVQDAEAARFSQQVERVGSELDLAARDFAPDVFKRIDAFQIGVSTEASPGTASSASGRIVLSPELATLDPTDDVVAFLIAREMGHVIARHAEENSGVRLLFSALSTLVPGASAIARLVASTTGSGALTSGWAEQQTREADEIALSLLERTHRSLRVVALNLRIGLTRERLPAGKWTELFNESSERVALLAEKAPAKARQPALAFAKVNK